MREICVGHEWSFGKDRAGNLALLKKLGAQLGFNVVGVEPVTSTARFEQHRDSKSGGSGRFRRGPRRCSAANTRSSGQWRRASISGAARFSNRQPERAQRAISAEWRLCRRGNARWANSSGCSQPRRRPTSTDGPPQRVLEFHLFDLDRDLYGEESNCDFCVICGRSGSLRIWPRYANRSRAMSPKRVRSSPRTGGAVRRCALPNELWRGSLSREGNFASAGAPSPHARHVRSPASERPSPAELLSTGYRCLFRPTDPADESVTCGSVFRSRRKLRSRLRALSAGREVHPFRTGGRHRWARCAFRSLAHRAFARTS